MIKSPSQYLLLIFLVWACTNNSVIKHILSCYFMLVYQTPGFSLLSFSFLSVQTLNVPVAVDINRFPCVNCICLVFISHISYLWCSEYSYYTGYLSCPMYSCFQLYSLHMLDFPTILVFMVWLITMGCRFVSVLDAYWLSDSGCVVTSWWCYCG